MTSTKRSILTDAQGNQIALIVRISVSQSGALLEEVNIRALLVSGGIDRLQQAAAEGRLRIAFDRVPSLMASS